MIEARVAEACASSNGRYEPRHVFDFGVRALWQIWLVVDDDRIVFVGATELVRYPTGLKALAWRFGVGDGRQNWQHLMAGVLAWARSEGCKIAEGCFRKGWRRVFTDWRHTHEFIERDIG